jgi:aminoglycoside phosphotransferase family enzyme/adenylate kinase family enzyme
MPSPEPPTAIQTHLSQVFLTGDRAYKLLRPVTTSFVDFSDRAVRLAAARQEFELNRRISPDVYLGLADVVEGDELADRMIVMRRLPDERRLDRLLADAELDDHLRSAARTVAAFHAGQAPIRGEAAAAAAVDALERNWADHFRALEPLAGPGIPAAEFERVQDLVSRYLAGRRTLLAERIDDGWVRDGHGDLRCEHVFLLDDGPRLIDCLAFRDDFRIADVLNDVAFLAMDLHRLAGPAAASRMVRWYDEFCNERHPASLAHHYVAYRAYVRAKVAAIRFAQGDGEAMAEVETYHRLALQHLEAGQPRLILVGGGAGVGKSTVAERLAEQVDATWLRADEIRKAMAGLQPGTHAFDEYQSGMYSPEFSDRVYRELLDQASLLLERGRSVVLDATWSSAGRRAAAREVAEWTFSELVELRCVAPDPVAKERIARRMADPYNPSDATPELVDRLNRSVDPWPEAIEIDTDQSIAGSVQAAYCHVMDGDADAEQRDESIRIEPFLLARETIDLFLARVKRFDGRILTVTAQRPMGPANDDQDLERSS